MSDDLAARVTALEDRITKLENQRKGRTGKQILVKAEGVCGLNPESDSSICPDATLHRRRQGCLGEACKQAAAAYFKEYRS